MNKIIVSFLFASSIFISSCGKSINIKIPSSVYKDFASNISTSTTSSNKKISNNKSKTTNTETSNTSTSNNTKNSTDNTQNDTSDNKKDDSGSLSTTVNLVLPQKNDD
jgi:hypothetical protein